MAKKKLKQTLDRYICQLSIDRALTFLSLKAQFVVFSKKFYTMDVKDDSVSVLLKNLAGKAQVAIYKALNLLNAS